MMQIGLRRIKMIRQIVGFVAIFLLLVLVLFPIFWMFMSSVTPDREQFRAPFTWLPSKVTFRAFAYVIGDAHARIGFFNSYVIGLGTAAISTLLAALAAYGFARFKSRINRMFLLYALVTQIFPWVLLVIPYFMIMQEVGLFDTHASLIISYCAFSLPFSLWMLRNYFETVPEVLDESAMIDGCSRIGAFTRIILPLASPAILATAVFSFLLAWNNFLFALVLSNTINSMPITVWIARQLGEFSTRWNNIMAVAIIQSWPLMIIFVLFQKYIVSGLTAGAIKG